MQTNDDFSCILAIEENHNSYLPINLKDIGINNYPDILNLAQLDILTTTVSLVEIKIAIKSANIVSFDPMDKKLIILAPSIKKKYQIITKEMVEEFDLTKELYQNINNKEFINRILNKLYNLNIDENLISSLKVGDLKAFIELFNNLSYVLQRNLYLYIIKSLEITKNKTRKRNKEKKD